MSEISGKTFIAFEESSRWRVSFRWQSKKQIYEAKRNTKSSKAGTREYLAHQNIQPLFCWPANGLIVLALTLVYKMCLLCTNSGNVRRFKTDFRHVFVFTILNDCVPWKNYFAFLSNEIYLDQNSRQAPHERAHHSV